MIASLSFSAEGAPQDELQWDMPWVQHGPIEASTIGFALLEASAE
jgi:hypothetical protein